MIIALPSSGKNLESNVDSRFGRTAGFIVYNSKESTFVYSDNSQNLNAAQGAGIQAAQNVAGTGADVVIAPSFGPKAFKVLKAAGVKTILCSPGTVLETIDHFLAGRLIEADSANVEGHW